MKSLVGAGRVIWLILRRDRFLLFLWIAALALTPLMFASAFQELYPTAEQRQAFVATSGRNPSFLLLFGPIFDSSIGALTAWRSAPVVVLVGLASLLTVIRHTRVEEETGRRELLGSTVVGRHSQLASALIVTFGANLALAALLALGMIGMGHPPVGSIAFGLSLAAVGWVFAAVGSVTAQLTESSAAARGIAIGALGLSYLLRAVGDVGEEGSRLSWLSWLSALGWAQRVRAYAGERWWILALALGFVVILVFAAMLLSSRRDVGAGVLRPRLGPAAAPPWLRGPMSLAWRLHRNTLFAWIAGFAVFGVMYGGVADNVVTLLGDSPQLRLIFERIGGTAALVDAFFAGIMGIFALAASAYAVQAALRLRVEETALRAEPVLATSVRRLSWAAGHLIFAVIGPVVLLAVAGFTSGMTYGLISGDLSHQLPRVLAAAMVQLPAVWVLVGISVALFGLLPRLSAVSWGALALFLLIGQVGPVMQLSQWILDLSPFTHVPNLPGGELSMAPLALLFGVGAGLTAAGLTGLARRDIGSGAG
ncbi:MAG: ABC transporter permease [Thermoleophilia bacterium]|nr:ABC transporter permease [Thermoleophilia bacterium]